MLTRCKKGKQDTERDKGEKVRKERLIAPISAKTTPRFLCVLSLSLIVYDRWLMRLRWRIILDTLILRYRPIWKSLQVNP